jgi:transposase
MKPGPTPKKVSITQLEYQELKQLTTNPEMSQRLRKRAQIILMSTGNVSNIEIASELGISYPVVLKWQKRFLDKRVQSLFDRPGRGRKSNVAYSSPIDLSEDEQQTLKRFAFRRKTSRALAQRARIILGAAGDRNSKIARREGITPTTVRKWRRRFLEAGIEGLHDEPKPGTPRKIDDEEVECVVVKTLESIPRNATHWSVRSMAKEVGMNRGIILRIWRAFGLQPHRIETFKLSNDPFFIEKVRDIVGLYLDPPERALVFCVDEKSHIQALDRSQPLLPLRPGVAERQTHDYRRHGTSSLLAALNLANGTVIGKCYRRHRTLEFRKFLDLIDNTVPKDLDLHIMLDNYGTHETALIHNWLLKRPRYHLHFTPTSSSWLNLIERWVAELTNKRIRSGTFRSVVELEKEILDWIANYNEEPKAFVWTKSADEILRSIKFFCERTSVS